MEVVVGVPGMEARVSIHNLRTVAPHYGELLVLLVYLTWLLHVGPRFETCLVPLSFGLDLPLCSACMRYLLYST